MGLTSNINDRQRTVLAMWVVTFFIVAVFFVPWRTRPNGDLSWAPLYREPITVTRTMQTDEPGYEMRYPGGRVAVDLLLGQIGLVLVAGAVAFRFSK